MKRYNIRLFCVSRGGFIIESYKCVLEMIFASNVMHTIELLSDILDAVIENHNQL